MSIFRGRTYITLCDFVFQNDNWWDPHAPNLSNLKILRDAANCDLTILLNASEETLLAHSFVLSSRSELMAIPLARQKDKKSKILRILDIDVPAFLNLVR